jgi:hypothetical protein
MWTAQAYLRVVIQELAPVILFPKQASESAER